VVITCNLFAVLIHIGSAATGFVDPSAFLVNITSARPECTLYTMQRSLGRLFLWNSSLTKAPLSSSSSNNISNEYFVHQVDGDYFLVSKIFDPNKPFYSRTKWSQWLIENLR